MLVFNFVQNEKKNFYNSSQHIYSKQTQPQPVAFNEITLIWPNLHYKYKANRFENNNNNNNKTAIIFSVEIRN